MTTYTLTPPATNGSYDGDMIVKQYTSLTVSSGNILTASQPCRGMFLYVSGDCTINGTLSMTARGAAADPTASGASDANAVSASGIKYGFYSSGGTDTLSISNTLFNGCGNSVRSAIANAISGSGTNYRVATIARAGAAGAAIADSAGDGYGNNITAGYRSGNHGTIGQSGGGGCGGQGYFQGWGKGGAGAAGTCFSGGSGGGGGGSGGGGTFSIKLGYAAAANGGAGGQGGADDESSGTRPPGGGGAGNPGGARGSPGGAGDATAGDNGTGGTLILVVGGNLTIGASGKIESNGSKGGWANDNQVELAVDANGYVISDTGADNAGGGAGSGGGNILIVVRGTITVNGTVQSATSGAGSIYGGFITAKGGRGGTGGAVNSGFNAVTNTRQGGFGGNGYIQVYSAL